MKYGFIGLGNMGSAIIAGMVRSGNFSSDSIYGFDKDAAKIAALESVCGLIAADSIETLCFTCDVVVLSVKPQMFPDVVPTVKTNIRPEALVISIAAGKTLEYFKEKLHGVAVARVMPNINALVGSATSAYCVNEHVTEQQKRYVEAIFKAVGTADELDEKLFSVFSALAGCSPAFTYLYIDALARAAVKHGMPRQQALGIAASAVFGSARMVMEDGSHPADLADRVCSPGGVTIEGVLTLRDKGFESAVHSAVDAMVAKDKNMQ